MVIELAVNAMELTEQSIRSCCSRGDGDFRSLVKAVQRRGVRVRIGEHFDVVRVSDLLAGVDVDQHGHWSLLSFLRPQCGSFREGLNSRTWPRFNARMTPMRANIVGPRNSTTRWCGHLSHP